MEGFLDVYFFGRILTIAFDRAGETVGGCPGTSGFSRRFEVSERPRRAQSSGDMWGAVRVWRRRTEVPEDKINVVARLREE